MNILQELKDEMATNKEVLFKIKVFPNSQENSLKTGRDGVINVKINESPEDGKANKALIKLIASSFGLRKYQVEIVVGLKDKIKTIKISR